MKKIINSFMFISHFAFFYTSTSDDLKKFENETKIGESKKTDQIDIIKNLLPDLTSKVIKDLCDNLDLNKLKELIKEVKSKVNLKISTTNKEYYSVDHGDIDGKLLSVYDDVHSSGEDDYTDEDSDNIYMDYNDENGQITCYKFDTNAK